MGVRERPLEEQEQNELDDLVEQGLEMLGEHFPENPDDPAQVIAAIRIFVDEHRTAPSDEDTEAVAFAIGALWGDEVRRALGWQWVLLRLDRGDELFCVVSPDRAVAIRPQLFLYRLLQERQSDNTAALAFNMLREGRLPPGGPGSYSLLE